MRTKLLIILSNNFPYPIVTGGQQAVHHMIRCLRSELDISIVYLDTNKNRDAAKALKEMWKEVSFIPYKKKYRLNYYSIKDLINRGVHYFLNRLFKNNMEKAIGYNNDLDPNFITFINKLIEMQHFDIVQTEFYAALPLVYGLPTNVKKVFVQHEIKFVRNERLVASLRTNQLDKSMINRCKSEEIAALNQYDTIITLTDVDKMILISNGVNSPVYDSPAIIYEGEINETESFEFENSIVFLGGSVHVPNYKGIKWFLEHVWTKFSSLYPDIVLKIIGNWENRQITELTNKY